MKTIMIDMDDVITCNNFEMNVEKYFGHKFDFSAFNGYRLQDALGKEKENFFNWLKENNFYDGATLLPDCYNTIKKLNEKYEVYIVTDYVWPEKEMLDHNGKFANDKYIFLRQNLDFMKPQQFIFATNKQLINCDIKIDDKLDNLVGAPTRLLFSAYHNQSLTNDELTEQNITRVNNWLEIENILLN